MNVSPIPTSRINSIHPSTLILEDPNSAGHRQEEGIDYDEVLLPVARIEPLGKIDEERILSQPLGFVDPKYPKKVYKVVKALYGLHQAPRAWPDIHVLQSVLVLGFRSLSKNTFPSKCYKEKLRIRTQIADYAKIANLTRKLVMNYHNRSLTFLDRRLIHGNCKIRQLWLHLLQMQNILLQQICGQVLWIQNQMLDYGFNFMNTKIYIDNESTICIVKNPVYHSKTKHIAIRHHFIRDAYEKKLIQVLKIHTDDNVADLLTKAFDVSRFQFLVVTIGMINP
ncbi:putative ribonuclease H-like domain-containing protein [Tanacetum coccineum]